MKKIFSTLTLISLTSFIAFAQPSEKTLLKVPKDAMIVMSFNFEHFLDKVSTDQFKSYEMVQYAYKMMKKDMGKDSTILKKLYKNPKSYGLAINPASVYFLKVDTAGKSVRDMNFTNGFIVPLKSGKKFEKLMVQTMKEKFIDFVEQENGYKYYLDNGVVIGWDKKNLVLMLSTNKEKTLSELNQFMTQSSTTSIIGDVTAKKALSTGNDITYLLKIAPLLGVYKKVLAKEFKGDDFPKELNPSRILSLFNLEDQSSTLGLNFDNGTIGYTQTSTIMKSQRQFSDLLQNERVNSKFRQYLPHNQVYGILSFATDIKKMRAMEYNSETQEIADSVQSYFQDVLKLVLLENDSSVIHLKEQRDTLKWNDYDKKKELSKQLKTLKDSLYVQKADTLQHAMDSVLTAYNLTEENLWNIFKGDFLLAYTGSQAVIDTFLTHDYIENEDGDYEYKSVKKTRSINIPNFRTFATSNAPQLLIQILDTLVSNEKLNKEDGYYALPIPFDNGINFYFAVKDNIFCLSNDKDFLTKTFITGKMVENPVSGKVYDLAFGNISAGYFDIAQAINLLGDARPTGSSGMVLQKFQDLFNNISMTSNYYNGETKSQFNLNMNGEKNSILLLMDMGNELFLEFNGGSQH